MAAPPPVGGQMGATTEPILRFLDWILPAIFLRSSSEASMLMWGSKRKMSTPSNLTPLTEALAVKSSMVSRSMAGSAPGLPLPTRPGHMALWSLGKLLDFAVVVELVVGLVVGMGERSLGWGLDARVSRQ